MVKRVHPWSLAKSSGENFGLRRERNGRNGRREGPDKGRENKIPAGACHEGMYGDDACGGYYRKAARRKMRAYQTDLLPELFVSLEILH